MSDQIDAKWMELAIELAKQAESIGEVPIGAVLVAGDEVLGKGFNQPIASCDPTAHAEIIALREAALTQRNYRLPNTTLYVTIEPCTMCVGAILHARVSTLVFGAREPRAGAVVSQSKLLNQAHYNHNVKIVEGVLSKESGQLLKGFFGSKRFAKSVRE
jgi:tRNA(adenine34) deaminase